MTKTKKKSVTFSEVAGRLEELEGQNLFKISRLLGYQSEGTAKGALYHWKRQGWIDFRVVKGVYQDFILLVNPKNRKESLEADDELVALRTWLAVNNAYRLDDLLDGGTLKPKERLEAIKELGRIERSLTSPKAVTYAKQIEEARGEANPWQFIK